jgi:hypothetical protein
MTKSKKGNNSGTKYLLHKTGGCIFVHIVVIYKNCTFLILKSKFQFTQ